MHWSITLRTSIGAIPMLNPSKLISDVYENRAKLLACVAVFFIALCLRQRQKLAKLELVVSSKPMVEERVITKVVQGPTRTEYRTIEKPGGETIVERIVYVERDRKS